MSDAARELHLLTWEDRLLDAIDRSAGNGFDGGHDAELRAHLDSCELCRERHAILLALHSTLRVNFAKAPALSAGFSARVFAQIGEQENSRRAAAKLAAEREFRRRLDALGFNWRDFWQRHFGNVVAALTAVGVIFAALGSTWDVLRAEAAATLGFLPFGSSSIAVPAMFMIAAPLIAGATMLWLRTKNR